MIIVKCDNCKEEIRNPDFRFEGSLVEIKSILDLGPQSSARKQVYNKQIHLCKKCYGEKLGL